MKFFAVSTSVFSLILASSLGCSNPDDGLPRTVPAKGKVMVNGSPVEGAVVVIMQESGANFARGITDKNGAFSLDAYETKKGAVPGAYKATVSKTVTVDKATKLSGNMLEEAKAAMGGDDSKINASWVNDLPNQYANPGTSGLSCTIPESGTSEIVFELKRGK
jgi:hypothetical protein